MTVTPNKIILASAALYILFWIIAPINVLQAPSTEAILLITLMYASFLIGANINKIFKRRNSAFKITTQAMPLENHCVKITLILFSIGLAFRAYDKIFIRNILSFSSAIERRGNLAESNLIGAVSAPLFMLALTIPALLITKKSDKRKTLIVLLIFFMPALEVMLLGNRGLALTSLSMLAIYYANTKSLDIKRTLYIGIFATILFFISTSIFIQRIESYGMQLLHTLFYSGYAYTMVPSDTVASFIAQGSPLSTAAFSITNFLQYYLHGLPELTLLLETTNQIQYQYGLYTFQIFNKLFYLIMGDSFAPYITPRFGVYTTLMGPLWVDFWIFSLAITLALGFFLSYLFKKSLSNRTYLPLYAYIATVIFFSPVVNLIQNALGVYVLTASLIIIYIGKKYKIRRNAS